MDDKAKGSKEQGEGPAGFLVTDDMRQIVRNCTATGPAAVLNDRSTLIIEGNAKVYGVQTNDQSSVIDKRDA